MFRSRILTPAIALLSALAFITGIFLRGLDQPLFTPALLLVLLMAGVMLAGGIRKGWSFPAAAPTGLLALFWFWMVLALSWSSVPQVSTIFTLLIGAMPLLVFSTLQHPRAPDLVRAQMLAIAAVMVIVALWALVQFFFLSEFAGSRIHHPMLNTNNLAVLLVATMFPMMQWFLRATGCKVFIPGLCFVVLFVAMLTTQSRGGLLGLLFGLGTFGMGCYPLLKHQAKRLIWLLAFMISGLFIVFSVEGMREEAIRFIGGGNSMASARERFMLLGAGLQMLKDYSFPGIGLGVFYLAFPPYRHAGDTSDGFFLHIDPLQFGIEMSLLASLLFYAFGMAVLIRTILAVRATQDMDDRAGILLPFAGLLALMVNTHVNFDLYMLPAQMMAAFLLMTWLLATEKTLGARRILLSFKKSSHAVFLTPVFILLFVLTPIWVVRAGFGVYEGNLASQALASKDMEAARSHIDSALKYGVPSYYRTYHLDAIWRSNVLRTEFYSLAAAERESLFEAALQSSDKALRYNPYYVHAVNQKALLYATSYPRLDMEGLVQVEKILQHALTLDPLSFDARLGLAKIMHMQGKKDQAIKVLEDGFYWDVVRRYAPLPYRQLLIQLKKETGQDEDVADLAKEMYLYVARAESRQKAPMEIDQWVDLKLKALLQ